MITIKEKVSPSWFDMPDGDPPSGFLLAPLSSVAWLDVRNEFEEDDDGNRTITGRGVLTAVRDSVRDWRNVMDEKGEAIPFNKALLADLSGQILLAIALEAFKRSRLSETERKN